MIYCKHLNPSVKQDHILDHFLGDNFDICLGNVQGFIELMANVTKLAMFFKTTRLWEKKQNIRT